ncbi:hypothetical protein PTTG_30039 [Puccinia triticina 1-1 BBBD Race 1]|uniref:Retrotransposon gag domain-containing protein n=1 Tax=Puccinia triticina (isolate 1-1 / race 1 (BBBD)) TaxID=630390 RepID=A0A180G0F5_PUCT1|nr:hypothetical protein PTTG_30039 [Puccinia triticina 1-1 BBBD Race 1]
MNFPSSSSNQPPADDPGAMSSTKLLNAIMIIQQNTAKQLLATQTQVSEAQRIAQEAIAQARADLQAVQKQARADVKATHEQARADQEASAARFQALESHKATSIVKDKSTPRLASGRIDLQKFRVSDGPAFKGPFQDVEPFLRWIQGVQIFYAMKDVTHADDKRLILGGLIAETNLLSFYANESPKYAGKTWDEFRACLFEFALPTKWRTKLKRSVNQLKMAETETFLEFSIRARTIQSLLNFDKHTLDDFNLAEAVTFGLPDLLQVKISDHRALVSTGFKYGEFESRTSGFYISLIKESALRLRPTLTAQNRTGGGRGINEDHLWQINSYLDSIGKCHFCKKHCGSPVGACPGPINRTRVEVPPSFVTPPRPNNYIRPNAWTKGQAANRGGAGKPTGRPAGVAALSEAAPELDELLASCVAQIDGQAEASLLGYDNPLEEIHTEHKLAALAGDPDTATITKGSRPLSNEELIPDDQITFRCGSLLSEDPAGDSSPDP